MAFILAQSDSGTATGFQHPSLSILVAGLITLGYLWALAGTIYHCNRSRMRNNLAYSISVPLVSLSQFWHTTHIPYYGVLGVFSCLLFLLTTLMNAHTFGVLPYGILGLA